MMNRLFTHPSILQRIMARISEFEFGKVALQEVTDPLLSAWFGLRFGGVVVGMMAGKTSYCVLYVPKDQIEHEDANYISVENVVVTFMEKAMAQTEIIQRLNHHRQAEANLIQILASM